jgi:hypothetical protein
LDATSASDANKRLCEHHAALAQILGLPLVGFLERECTGRPAPAVEQFPVIVARERMASSATALRTRKESAAGAEESAVRLAGLAADNDYLCCVKDGTSRSMGQLECVSGPVFNPLRLTRIR